MPARCAPPAEDPAQPAPTQPSPTRPRPGRVRRGLRGGRGLRCRGRLRRGPALLPAVSAVLLTACSALGAATDEVGPASGSTGTGDGFPRVVRHELGVTSIPARPRRVVAVTDGAELASLLALGVDPVGFGQRNDPLRPWLTAAGAGKLPTYRIHRSSDLNFDRMVAWRPDLLLVQAGFATRENLAQFQAIAPTVVTSFVNWRESLREVAEATGTTRRAAELVAANEAAIATTRAALTSVKGLRLRAFSVFDGLQIYSLNSASPLGKLAPELGLAPFPKQESIGEAVETLPLERLPNIGADVLMVQRFKGTEAAYHTLKHHEVWSRVPAVRAGRLIELTEFESDASYFDSVLTVPLNLKMLRERLG